MITLVLAAMAFAAIAICRERTPRVLLSLGILSLTFSGIAIGPLTAPDIFLLPAGILLIISSLVHKELHIPPWTLGVAALIAIGGLLPHLFLAATPTRSGTILAQFALSILYVPLVVALGTRSYSDLRHFAGCFVLSASMSSILGIVHFLGISDIASRLTGFQGLVYNGGRVSGLSAHPNQLGFACALAMPLCLYLYTRNNRWLIALVLLAGGVMVSGSRAGLIAFALACVILLSIGRNVSRRTILLGLALLAFVLVLAGTLGLNVAFRRLMDVGPSVTQANSERAETLSSAVRNVMQYPLTGVGFGYTAHNLYLSLLEGGGVLVLIGFLWFAKRLLRTARLLGHHPVVSAAGVSMVVWLITGLLQPGLYDRYLYLSAGLLLGAQRLMRMPSESGPTEALHPSSSHDVTLV